MGPTFNLEIDGSNRIIIPPLCFDFSQTDHKNTQNFTWNKIMGVVDGLVDLLKSESYKGDPLLGSHTPADLKFPKPSIG